MLYFSICGSFCHNRATDLKRVIPLNNTFPERIINASCGAATVWFEWRINLPDFHCEISRFSMEHARL